MENKNNMQQESNESQQPQKEKSWDEAFAGLKDFIRNSKLEEQKKQ